MAILWLYVFCDCFPFAVTRILYCTKRLAKFQQKAKLRNPHERHVNNVFNILTRCPALRVAQFDRVRSGVLLISWCVFS